MGATGSGKSKLSIDLATRFFPSEIINSDKIQVSKGIDITTNKISINEQGGVVHHLLVTPVLNRYLFQRVDEMKNGFSDRNTGIRKAIGVPEMEGYFRNLKNCTTVQEKCRLYDEAVREIKENTKELAEKQMWKIQRLRESGWDLQKVDATEALRAKMSPENSKIPATEIWERQVVLPSMKIVKQFLLE
ncbi:hypothetical protein MTR67_021591 [Solanum verrucosum]|uniref:Isopentenyltransferase n=1 Tax=Solanum verrucosum TaxID=315347 RepID=A0AAF0TQ28_SOLVR|nr:hypothetical protein MTR67_021591 [Solanum verrucosum]